MAIKFCGSETAVLDFKKQCYASYEHCAQKWFDRFLRYRDKYYKDGRVPTDCEETHLDYLLAQHSRFEALKNEIIFD